VVTGITVASYCLGSLIGCLISFAIGDILGRRRMIWLAMGLIIIGATLQTSAFSLAHLITGRIITGFGTGIDSSTVPMYQSELSKKEWRGRLVSWEILFIGIGITLAYWIVSMHHSRPERTADNIQDYGFSYVESDVAWRTPIGIQLTFAIIVTIIVFGLPESPRWLAKRGRFDEAQEVVCAVYDLQPDDPYVIEEMENIRQVLALEESEHATKWTSLFKSDHLKTRRRVIMAWFVLFFNQLSGINLVVYYLPTVSLYYNFVKDVKSD
jgi:MFS family permease